MFAASFGFFLLAMAVLSFVFALGTLRLNICLMFVEWGLTFCFSLLAATFWLLAQGNAAVATKCLTVSLALLFGMNFDECFANCSCRQPVRSDSSLLLVLGGFLQHRS